MLRGSIVRAAGLRPTSSAWAATRATAAALRPSLATRSQQTRQQHAISNPTLANIEKRWEGMPPQEQAELWMALRDRMKNDWHELTVPEKKAAYWIAFGPHGPRAQTPPGESRKVFLLTMLGLAVAGVIFAITRAFARPPPRTMTKEYQEATERYLKDSNVEPITGISAEDWKGNFAVQSKPAGK